MIYDCFITFWCRFFYMGTFFDPLRTKKKCFPDAPPYSRQYDILVLLTIVYHHCFFKMRANNTVSSKTERLLVRTVYKTPILYTWKYKTDKCYSACVPGFSERSDFSLGDWLHFLGDFFPHIKIFDPPYSIKKKMHKKKQCFPSAGAAGAKERDRSVWATINSYTIQY